MVLSKYPDATMLDTSGLATAAIDSLIATVSATSQNRIYALVDVGANPPSGNLTAGQITDLDGKLSTDPGSDTATIQIAATSGTPVNSVTNRTALTWASVYPVDTPAWIAHLSGRINFWIQLGTGTASAGAAGTITNAAAQYPVDGLVGMWVEIVSGTGAGQIREILTNSATVITVAGGNWATTPDNTSVYRIRAYKQSSQVIYSAQAATAGAASTITNGTATYTTNALIGYTVQINSGTGAGQEVLITSNTGTVITVATDWSVNPDNTSVFSIVSYQYRNSDETIYEESQTATSGGANTIVVSTQTWATNVYTGKLVRIVGGTGSGQSRYIASNTATTLTVTQAWAVNPDSTSEFEIYSEGGTWPYELADFYWDLAMTYYNDITIPGHTELFNAILGKKTFQVAQDEGNQQDLVALQTLLDRGKVIYDYENPA